MPNRMLAGGWTTTMAVLNDLRTCLIPRAAHLKATAQMPVSIELIGTSQRDYLTAKSVVGVEGSRDYWGKSLAEPNQ